MFLSGQTTIVRWIIVVVTAVLLFISFTVGFISGVYEIFPYGLIYSAKNIVEGYSDSTRSSRRTSLVMFDLKTYNRHNSLELGGYGGGLEIVDNVVLGVDRKGQFFRYDGDGRIILLPISIETGENEFLKHVSSLTIDKQQLLPSGFFPSPGRRSRQPSEAGVFLRFT